MVPFLPLSLALFFLPLWAPATRLLSGPPGSLGSVLCYDLPSLPPSLSSKLSLHTFLPLPNLSHL